MKQFWNNLQAKERYLLIGAAGIIILLLAYLLVIEPWQKETRRLRDSIAEQQQTLQWMQQSAAEIQQLRQRKGVADDTGQSLMSIIDASTREAGIGQAVRQLRPDGQAVSVRLEDASFDAVVNWLSMLQSQHGIAVSHFSMERLARVGHINANVMLASGGV